MRLKKRKLYAFLLHTQSSPKVLVLLNDLVCCHFLCGDLGWCPIHSHCFSSSVLCIVYFTVFLWIRPPTLRASDLCDNSWEDHAAHAFSFSLASALPCLPFLFHLGEIWIWVPHCIIEFSVKLGFPTTPQNRGYEKFCLFQLHRDSQPEPTWQVGRLIRVTTFVRSPLLSKHCTRIQLCIHLWVTLTWH